MRKRNQRRIGINAILHGDDVRRAVDEQGQTWYAAVDVVSLLGEAENAHELWPDIKRREPSLQQWVATIQFPAVRGRPQTNAGLSLEGVLRLVQSIPSPKAERLRQWLARSATQHLQEADNPELLALRARKLYEQRGYSRRWVDKRLRGVSARHELTGEWYKRGATEGESFRALTNRLMHSAFGMDAETYRRYKLLHGANQNLRDHMSDLELALTSLGETVAVALHQARDSHGFDQLEADAKDAGEIVARTRQQIEHRSGRPVVHPGHHELPARPPRRAHRGPELAKTAEDMHNSSHRRATRTVA